MSNKATTSAYLGGLEWCLSGYSNERRSRVLSCSAGDVAASLLFEPEDYDPYLSLTGEDDKVILKIERDLVQSGSTDGEDGGVLTIRLIADRHEDVYETSVADVVAVLRQESDKVAVNMIHQGLVDHWLFVLAERLIEVMMCTDISNYQNTTIDFNVDEIEENLKESALCLVHKIEHGHVGLTASLLGNMVYHLPSCKSIDELLEMVRPVGLGALRMKGSLKQPVEETKFFCSTPEIVTASLIPSSLWESFQKTLNKVFWIHAYFNSCERRCKRASLWELRLTQATASKITSDADTVSLVLKTGSSLYYYHDDEMEPVIMTVFDELSSNVIEDVGSVINTDGFFRLPEILVCSVSEVLIRYITGRNGVFSSKKDGKKNSSSELTHFSVIHKNQNTSIQTTENIISKYNISESLSSMMLGVVDNLVSVCLQIDKILTNKANNFSSVIGSSALESLNKSICRQQNNELDDFMDVYNFTMEIILCLVRYLNELVFLGYDDVTQKVYDTHDSAREAREKVVQATKTAIDLLKALESADNRTR